MSLNPSNTTVVRIRRERGQVVQDCDVYIGRACNQGGWCLRQSKWHNPYTLRMYGSREVILKKYERYLRHSKLDVMELQGKILGCWCHPEPCHGDVIVKLINERLKTTPIDEECRRIHNIDLDAETDEEVDLTEE